MPAGLPFLCVGAAHRDLVGRAAGEAGPGADLPGEITERPGGVALNIALALAALCRPVTLVASLGADAAALAAAARAAGVDCGHVLHHPGPGDRYLAIEDAEGELVAAVADCRRLEQDWPALADAAAAAAAALGPAFRLLDGNLPATAIARLAAPPGPLAAVAASPAKAARLRPLVGRPQTRLYLNRAEAEALAGVPLPDTAAAVSHLAALGAAAVLVTDGPAAATAGGAAEVAVSALPPAVAVRGVTGAGDRLVAAHLAALADGHPPAAALHAALAAAASHIRRNPA